MRSLLLLTSLSLYLLCGCTTDIEPAVRKNHVRAIKLEPRVDVLQPLRYGFDANSGNLSVALANLIVKEMYASNVEALGSEMATNAIHVPTMVRDRAAALLREAKALEITTNAADATLVMAIQQYGFSSSGFKNSRYIPFIVVKAELLDRSGKRLWSGQGQANPIRDDDVGAPVATYSANPQLLRDHWQHQIEVALKRLLSVK